MVRGCKPIGRRCSFLAEARVPLDRPVQHERIVSLVVLSRPCHTVSINRIKNM